MSNGFPSLWERKDQKLVYLAPPAGSVGPPHAVSRSAHPAPVGQSHAGSSVIPNGVSYGVSYPAPQGMSNGFPYGVSYAPAPVMSNRFSYPPAPAPALAPSLAPAPVSVSVRQTHEHHSFMSGVGSYGTYAAASPAFKPADRMPYRVR